MVGGRGGWILDHSLVLGGGGYAGGTEVDAPEGVMPLATAEADDQPEGLRAMRHSARSPKWSANKKKSAKSTAPLAFRSYGNTAPPK
jgi:hypothetical protein